MKTSGIRRSGIVASARQALSSIPDSSVMAVSGFNMAVTPEYLLLELLELYKSTGHPRNLFLIADACPAVPGRALDKVAEWLYNNRDAGLFRGASMPFFGFAPWFQKLVSDNIVEGYSWPMGVDAYWFREVASGRPGVISKIGVDTSTDPRRGGGRFNELAEKRKTCTVRRILIDDEDYLIYEAPKPNAALVRATCADPQGNLTMEEELMRGTVQSIAQATKAQPNPGIVIAQVRRVASELHAPPRMVEVPGPFVDYVVVSPPQYHWQTGSSSFDERLVIGSPEAAAAAGAYVEANEEPHQTVIARRVLLELVQTLHTKNRPIVVNLGIGIPALVSNMVQQENVTDYIVTVLESGQWGGVALSGADFGVAINPFALMSMPDMFSNFEGGMIDAASLGFLQVEESGDVNPSMLPGRLFGPGGFPVIAGGSPRLYFAGAFTAGRTEIGVEGGKLLIRKDGQVKKFVKTAYRSFFSGKQALRLDKEVLYVTERAVFKLTPEGLALKELAPGVDLERDVLSKMEFSPKVGRSVGEMDPRIFSKGKMGIADEI
jgi:acyl CoA:acetate/3-ketoacid CoA transferase